MNSIYVSVASWEPRFSLGIEKSLQAFNLEKVVVLYSTRSSQRTAPSRAIVSDLCERHSVKLEQLEVDFEDQIKIFKEAAALALRCADATEVYLDISTSPRDVSIIFGREFASTFRSLKFAYYPAESYGNWLSKEAGSAKIIVGASGLMYPDKPTCVLAFCANSIERIEQVYNHFEPSKMVILWDPRRAQYGSQEPLAEEIKSISQEIEFSQTDFSDGNRCKILSLVGELVENYNIIAVSTGPKVGVVHIMNMIKSFPEVGAAYIPSRFYNDEYSYGVASPKIVEFPFPVSS